ncbi:MAG: Gfo/Idh/MocA family oxidoreductase [Bacteroidota bacterium]|nr:Gfo/Idh/MocA family oxidoreductase [Bacteroidota bacterium]
MDNRREFLKKATIASAGLAIGGKALGFTAKSYNNIIGANDRIHMACIGLNGRGHGMSVNFSKQKNTVVDLVCDVDSRTLPKAISAIMKGGQASTPKTEKDCRKVMEDKSIDAIYIATPDHWHAPMTIMGCQAGKNVYVEKPLSHNPREGEIAIAAARKYDRVVQMGAQRRSAPVLRQGIEELHNGVIGRVYLAKTWYTNTRKSNFLKPGTVPDWLDYELWQGPAPRVPYRDGLIHYNWHWFWDYGTGEALNNGTHEVDVARWGLGVEYPIRVTSVGGRYHYQDDWQTPDTQIITMDYPGRISLMWECRSSNGRNIEGSDRGIIFYGEKGSLDTGGDSYKIYDNNGKLIKEVKSTINETQVDARNTATVSPGMDNLHIADFLDAIRNHRRPNCDVELGHKSIVGMQVGNIAWRLGRDIKMDPKNGHILNDPEAQKLWGRTYQKGWEPKI